MLHLLDFFSVWFMTLAWFHTRRCRFIWRPLCMNSKMRQLPGRRNTSTSGPLWIHIQLGKQLHGYGKKTACFIGKSYIFYFILDDFKMASSFHVTVSQDGTSNRPIMTRRPWTGRMCLQMVAASKVFFEIRPSATAQLIVVSTKTWISQARWVKDM